MNDVELFKLGEAYGLFSIGQYVAGAHTILPAGKDNEVFQSLFDRFDAERLHELPEGTTETCQEYMRVILDWAKEQGHNLT